MGSVGRALVRVVGFVGLMVGLLFRQVARLWTAARWRRRLVLPVVVALLLVTGVPSGIPLPGPDGPVSGWPVWGWLRSLMVSPAQAAVPTVPQQVSGTARGAASHVDAAATRAGRGAGRAPGKGKGELPAWAPRAPKVTPYPVHGQQPEVVAAVRKARATKTPVPVTGLTSGTSETVANPNGSVTRKVTLGTARVRQPNGSWADVDLTLTPAASGGFVPKVSPVPVAVAGGGDTVAASMAVAGGVAQIGWPTALPAPTVSGNVATYPDVRPGVDLVVTVLRTGFSTDFVIRSRPAGAVNLPLTLTLQGLSAQPASDGTLQITDAKGRPVGGGAAPEMYGAALDPTSHLPSRTHALQGSLSAPAGGRIRSLTGRADVPRPNTTTASSTTTASGTNPSTTTASSTTASTTSSSSTAASSTAAPKSSSSSTGRSDAARAVTGSGTVTTRTWQLTPDTSFLADPGVTYPVTVDPSMNFQVSQDTYIKSGVSASQYYATRLYIGTPNSGTTKARTFVHLPVSPGDFYGLNVSNAYLQLYNTYSATCAASAAPVSVSGTGAWDSTTTWAKNNPTGTASPPALGTLYGTAYFAHAGNSCAGAAYDNIPLTSLVRGWANGSDSTTNLAVTASESDTHGWKEFTSIDNGSGIPTVYLTYSVDVAPQVDSQYPPNNFTASSLTPELIGYGHDPDGGPGGLQYEFTVYNEDGSTAASSGRIGSGDWVVPSGSLVWGKNYFWTVQTYDGVEYSDTTPVWNSLSTAVPQPLVTSQLSQNAGHGYEPTIGNYTTSVTDADVSTVGPSLAIQRDYNSLDVRRGGAFGAGWSSLLDAKVSQVPDGSGVVQTAVVTYPDGRDVAFGRNADGSFTPPQGRFTTLVWNGGGYTLTDKNDTVYQFNEEISAGVYTVTGITDASGRHEDITGVNELPTQITAVSGRHLFITWSTPSGASAPHVATVSTDPATAGQPATWTYSYSGDRLTSVCPPTSSTACTSYAYTASTLYPDEVAEAGPASYWRLGEAAGATRAASAVLANEGTDNATYTNVTLGQPGSLAGSAATSAGFNGTSSQVRITNQLALGASYQTLSLRFKTTGTDQVLFSYQADPIENGHTDANFTPAMYIGTDGRLLAEFWTGTVDPIATGGPVNDGTWHEAVLVGRGNTQTLYLDGSPVGSLAGQIILYSSAATQNIYLGTGYIGGYWPDEKWQDVDGANPLYFTGQLSDAAFYTHALPAGTVSTLAKAAASAADELATVTRPSGSVFAQVGYDTAAGRVSQVTDDNGGVWKLALPTVSGSSQVSVAAVLGAGPRNYWRLADTSGTQPVNQVKGDPASYVGGVTLGTPGRFPDATAATFDGSSGYVDTDGALVVDGGNQSLSLWFKTTGTNQVLASYHTALLSDGVSPTQYDPMLYLDSDGKLRGQYWQGDPTNPITSATAVNDGNWHNVVLAAGTDAQTMYLDGAAVGSLDGHVAFEDPSLTWHSEVGAGYLGGSWPGQPNDGDATPSYFTGSISDVAVFRTQLTAAQAQALYGATGASSGLAPMVSVSVTDPGGAPLTYRSDPLNGNRQLSQTDAAGKATTYGYDTSGFLYTTTAPSGAVTTTGHDVRGNIVSSTTCQDRAHTKCSTVYYTYSPDDTSATLSPDARNDLLLTVRDGRSSSADDTAYLTSYGYDSAGNRTAVTTPPVLTGTSTTPATRTTTTTYTTSSTASVDGKTTPPGLPATVKTPGGATTRYSYFASGDLAQVADPVGLVVKFTYDGLGRRLTTTEVSDSYPSGLTTSQTYDGEGRVVSQTEPAFTDRVTGAVHTPTRSTVFDVDGNVTSQTVSDATGGDAARTVRTSYDGHDRPATETDASGAVTSFGYGVYGDLVKQVDASGTEVDYVHDGDGQLLTTTLVGYTGDPSNPSPATNLVESARAYDPDGRLASITDAMGRSTTYTYTDDGLLASVVRHDVAPSTATFTLQSNTYDAAGNLVSRTTNNGATTVTTAVDAAGRTTATVVDPTGLKRTSSYTYTADDALATTRLSDASSTWSTVSAGYDAAGRMTSRSLTGSVAPGTTRTTSWTLDKRGRPTATTDPAGKVTNTTYDEAGHLVQALAPAVATETGGGTPVSTRAITTTGYNTFGEVAETTDPNGNTTTYGYDAEGRHTSTTLPAYTPPGASSPVAATATVAYNGLGQQTSSKDPLGQATTWTYDQLGDITAVTAPDTTLTRTTYDTNGEPLSITDAAGAVSRSTYDYLGRRITKTEQVRTPSPASYTTTYGYDTGGFLSQVTSPAGVVTKTTNDAAGEPVTTVDGAGNTTRHAYDLAGRTTTTTLPDNTQHTVAYDDAGQPLTTSDLDAAGTVLRTQTAGYDAVGNLVSTKDARGNTSTFSYDAVGVMTGEVQPVATGATITTSFGHDAAGNKTRFTDGRGNLWLTSYTSRGQIQSQIEPATTARPAAADRTFTAGYDANGRLTAVTMPGGVNVANSYDALGHLTGSTGTGAEAATTARTFGYDTTGRMTSASAPAGTDTFGYDDRGLLTSTTGPSGASSFTYTADGAPATRTDAAGTTRYTYDTAGRLSTVADPLTTTAATYSYNNLNLPTSIAYGTSQNTRSFSYDSLHRLTGDTLKTNGGATLASIAYGYDPNDNITSKTTTGVAGAAANTYTYDAANRLTSWNTGSKTTTYAYDANGNLTQAGSTTYTYDQRNQLLSDGTRTYAYTARGTLQQVTSGGTTTASTFDAFGQTITQGDRTYAYDSLGRLVSATGGASGTAAMSYSGTGLTLASDGTSTYSYDSSGGLFGVKSPAGAVLALTDQHDDVVGQFTAAGTVLTGSATYDPFGTVLASSGLRGQLGFQSGWTDPVTAKVDMGSRWYDPGTARFTSRDATSLSPAPASVSANRFAYVDDNPLGGTDPTGQCSWYDVVCGAKKTAAAATSAASAAVHYTTAQAEHYTSVLVETARTTYHVATTVVTHVVNTTVHTVKVVAHKVVDAYHVVQRKVVQVVHTVKQVTTRVVHAVVKKVTTAVKVMKTAYQATAHAVAKAAKATGTFVKHHAGTIASVVTTAAVFAGCEAATATGGSIGCAALAGAAGNAVGFLVDAAAGNKKFSWSGLGMSALSGAATGAAFAGLGALGGKLAGYVGSKLAGTALGDLASAGADRFAASALGRGLSAVANRVGSAVNTALSPARAAGTALRSALGRDGEEAAANSLVRSAAGAEARGAAEGEAEAAGGGAARGPGCKNSFAAGTLVALAGGATKAIDKLKLGDKVLAADPKTGVLTAAEPVTHTFINHDDDLLDLTIHTTTGNTVIHTTDHHPFYDTTRHTWIDAANLPAGDHLATTTGQAATVVSATTIPGQGTRYNLTVNTLHTYYVLAGTTPVLVHNCDVALGLRDEGDLRNFAEGNGYTHFLDLTRDDALAAVRNVAHEEPTTQIHVVLDGFRMSNGKLGSFQDVFEDFYKEGRVGGNWITTQHEMNILGESVRLGNRAWDSITFWHKGEDVTGQLRLPDFSMLRGEH